MLVQVLEPGPDEARSWLAEELAKPEYHSGPGLLERLWNWLQEALAGGEGGSPLLGWVVLALLVLVLAAGAWRYLRTARRDPLSAKDARATDLVDPRLTPADYRALATDHLAHGRLDSALVDAFRAIVSDLDRRAVLGDVPGRTVTEIAAVAGRTFPDERDEIADAARWFDRAAYGHRSSAEERSSRDQVVAVLDLGERLAAARPVHADGTGGAHAAAGHLDHQDNPGHPTTRVTR